MRLLIRADASTTMGTGHVMRCIALAQAWQDQGGQVTMAMAISTPALEQRLQDETIQVVHLPVTAGSLSNAEATAHLAAQLNSSWVVVDGYQFDAAYQKALKTAGLKLLFLDDYGHSDFYAADLILNQNINAEASLYSSRESDTELLLGTRYALLRREFRNWIGWQRPVQPVATRLLVTLGGADPDNVTLKVINALLELDAAQLEAIVVVGGSNPHFGSLQSAAKSNNAIQLVQNATNMPELMAWADLAISAGGSTCWEMAFMGLPSLILILADNQRLITEKLDEKEVAINLGWHQQVSEQAIRQTLTMLISNLCLRNAMTQLGQNLVDGRGTERILMYLINRA